MTTIRQSQYVMFDGISSEQFGIMNVNISNGLQDEPYMGGTVIHETKSRFNDKPFFHSVERQPLAFTLNLAFQDAWDDDSFREVKRWLRTTDYKPLIFSEMPEKIYYAQIVDEPKLYHTTVNQGYIQANFRCNAPYPFSAVQSVSYDLTSNPESGTQVAIYNYGDESILATVKFEKVNFGNISIQNLNNGGQTLLFSNISDAVTVQIDCATDIIQSESSSTLSFTGTVNDSEKVIVGSRTYEFDNNASVVSGNILVDVSSDNSAYGACIALINTINNDAYSPVVAEWIPGTNKAYITTKMTGSPDGTISLSETCTNAHFDISSLDNSYHDSKWNGEPIELTFGKNNLSIKGTCKLSISYQYKFL